MEFSFEKWSDQVFTFDTVEDVDFKKISLKDFFILEIKNKGVPLHFLFGGFSLKKDFIVGFSGALSKRTESMNPPFFSFLNIAKEINAPYILVADPTLYLSKDLKLAWYAGNEKYIELQKDIAFIINKAANYFESSPVLTGGSGGGFASLAISSYLNVEHNVFIWNPQTSISNYYKRFVDEYTNVAFPEYESLSMDKVFSLIKSKGISTEVITKPLNIKTKLLYIQNYSDDHRITHAEPFLRGQKFCDGIANKCSVNYKIDDEKLVVLANWGEGHVEPPRIIIYYVLNELIKGNSIVNITDNIFKVFDKEFKDVHNKL